MTAEWRHVTGRFYAFIAALAPTPEERARVHAVTDDAAGLVARRFTCYGTTDHRIIGGFAKGTSIRPVRSVDVLCALPKALAGKAELPRGPRALTPLHHDLIGVLSLRYGVVQTTREGWLSVTSGRGDEERIHVRVVPTFSETDGSYRISAPGRNTRQATWRRTDPAAEAVNLRRADALSGGKATHLVRMLKAWRLARSVPISSFVLELLAVEFVSVWTYHRRSLLFYDWMIRDFFFWATAQAGRLLPIPGSEARELEAGDAWLDNAWTAYEVAREASERERERDNRDGDAVAMWRTIFGPTFGAQSVPALSPAWRLPAPGTAAAVVAK